MNYNNIILEKSDLIATLIINRPKKLNALNLETISEINDALSVLNDDNSVRVIIITGSGEKAFIAGADISEFANFNTEDGYDLSLNGHKNLCDYIENLSKPVIEEKKRTVQRPMHPEMAEVKTGDELLVVNFNRPEPQDPLYKSMQDRIQTLKDEEGTTEIEEDDDDDEGGAPVLA